MAAAKIPRPQDRGHHVFCLIDQLDSRIDKNIVQILCHFVIALTCFGNDEVEEDDESDVADHKPDEPKQNLLTLCHEVN